MWVFFSVLLFITPDGTDVNFYLKRTLTFSFSATGTGEMISAGNHAVSPLRQAAILYNTHCLSVVCTVSFVSLLRFGVRAGQRLSRRDAWYTVGFGQ